MAQQIVRAPPSAEHQRTGTHETVQSKHDALGATSIPGASGPGAPLAPDTRAFFEPRLGADLSRVRVHTDAAAGASARAANARAFTTGDDIAFGPGRYDPRSDDGKQLLAHELTHVVQAGIAAGSRWRAAGAPPITAHVAPNVISRQLDDAMTPDTRQLSGTQLEAEIARLHARLEQLPQEGSEERESLEQQLAALEANLTEREAAALASSIVTAQLRESSLPIENRISMAFGAGFAAGALMEFRPSEAQRLVEEIQNNPGHFGGGILVGILEGAGLDLWNNIVGLGELLLWSQPAYWQYRAAQEAIEYFRDPPAYRAHLAERRAQIEALTTGLAQLLVEVAHDPNILVTYGEELGRLAGQRAAQWFNDDFMRKTPYEKGESVGIVVGTIIMEIALLFVGPEEWIARGAAAASEAVRASARLERAIVELLEHVPSLRRLLELRRAAGGARVIEDTAQGARALEHVAAGAGDAERAGQVVSDAAGATRDAERVAASSGSTVPPTGDVIPSGVPPQRPVRTAHADSSGVVFHEPSRPPVDTVRRPRVTVDEPRAIIDEPAGLAEHDVPREHPFDEGLPEHIEGETGVEQGPLDEVTGPERANPSVSSASSLERAAEAGIPGELVGDGTVMTRADFPDVVPDAPPTTGRVAPERLEPITAVDQAGRPVGSRPVSRSELQNVDVLHDYDLLVSAGADPASIRVNQMQIIEDMRVGTNRPDLYAELNGHRILIEYDRAPGTRAIDHARRILSNDPDAIVILKIVDFD